MIRLTTTIATSCGKGFWQREIVYPVFPYPGLHVGSFRVKKVYVCQGDLDGRSPMKTSICVELSRKDVASADVMEMHGWEFVEAG